MNTDYERSRGVMRVCPSNKNAVDLPRSVGVTRPSVKLEALNFAPAEFPWIQGRDGKDGRVAVRNGKAEARRRVYMWLRSSVLLGILRSAVRHRQPDGGGLLSRGVRFYAKSVRVFIRRRKQEVKCKAPSMRLKRRMNGLVAPDDLQECRTESLIHSMTSDNFKHLHLQSSRPPPPLA